MIRALSDVINWLETQSPENPESEIPALPIKIIEDQELSVNQIQIIEKMVDMFVDYNDPKLNLRILAGMYHLLTKPETKVTIPLSKRGIDKSLFTFTERLSANELIKFILNIVKNRSFKTRDKDLPRFRAISERNMKNHKNNSGFSIDINDKEKLKMNFAKRAKSRFSTGKSNSLHFEKGRVIDYTSKKIGNLALTRTILNSAFKGNYSIRNKRFEIQRTDFCYPRFETNVNYNIMLVLDTSDSISWVVPHIEKFLTRITSKLKNSRDKLGLITFNKDVAQIFHYPTLNVKQIIGTINKLDVKGKTPLGEGLNLASQVFSKNRFNHIGTKNLIVLISDCYPEPLEGGYMNLLEEPSYKLVLSAAEKIRDNKIGFIIINPNTINNKWNKKLIDKMISITGAKYIQLKPRMTSNVFKGSEAHIEDESLTDFFSAINDVKMNL